MTLAEGGIDLFIPETYDIVWSLIILVIVAVFFYKFFMPKFNAIFDERAAKIQGNIAKAEQAKKDADEAKAKYEAQLSTARVDAAKIRGRKKAIKEMVLQATQDIGHSTAIVAYANDIEAAENLKEQLLAVDGIEQVLIMPLGPVISTHVGPDTLAVFTIGKEAR